MQFSLNCTRRHVVQRLYRFTSKIAVDVDPTVISGLEQATLKPRKHPGIVKPNHLELPQQLGDTLKRIVGDHPVKKVLQDSQMLNSYIRSRHPPPTLAEIENKKKLIVEEVNAKMSLERLATLSEEEADRWKRKRELEINKRLSQRTYAWKPIEYGAYEAIVYAVARGAQEYAVLKRVLTELAQRDEHFKPRSYFDFGSGVGTGMWVASELWKENIFEYYNVDRSREMNELSELILRDGQENKQISLRNVFYRQFLPAIETKYDLIIISHTLFEMVDKAQREEVLLNLWRKCDGYMVIAEEGTRRGCELVNDARRFLLHIKDEELQGHTFAPRFDHSHKPGSLDSPDLSLKFIKCLRAKLIGARSAGTSSNFEMTIYSLKIHDVALNPISFHIVSFFPILYTTLRLLSSETYQSDFV
ncbi:methyltransferase-like protein 17, mitochondrial isoform X2 [Drosophila pseudoobscura]|uniref:Methyltransferase-like protein 17, mitochondrial isoform X2 n=1 Tax=Drosophila pseudoobscura pseudoobscura TaxID=46245 RepID=A0A6I8VVU8_DROPS|nr:methyltransferase-like protein 17, mitochondrial isoform X2 [Drosophila pseudoobscura]